MSTSVDASKSSVPVMSLTCFICFRNKSCYVFRLCIFIGFRNFACDNFRLVAIYLYVPILTLDKCIAVCLYCKVYVTLDIYIFRACDNLMLSFANTSNLVSVCVNFIKSSCTMLLIYTFCERCIIILFDMSALCFTLVVWYLYPSKFRCSSFRL